jgi:hypothetical protein
MLRCKGNAGGIEGIGPDSGGSQLILWSFTLLALIGGSIVGVVVLAARPAPAGAPSIDIGAVLGDAFALLKRHGRQLLPAALLLEGVPEVLEVIYGPDDDLFTLGTLLRIMVIGCFLQAMLVRASIRLLEGRATELREGASLVLRRLLPIIGASLLSWLCIIAGFALLIVPGFMAAAAFAVVVPVIVEERTGVVDALKRSHEITRGARARVLALLFIFTALMLVVLIPVEIAGGAFPDEIWLPAIIQGVGASLTAMFLAALLASLYVHLRRVRGEEPHDALQEIFR